jgi:GAF domain-containing protein
MSEHKRAEAETDLLQTLSEAIREAPDFHTALSLTLLQVGEVTDWDYGEVWIPSKDGTVLELTPVWYISNRKGSASVSALEQFRFCSEEFILPPATGLPGRVWSSQQPELIPDVSAQSETYFLRNQIAKACGVKAGLGIPILANHQVLAVLVFFMSEAREEDRRLVELVAAVATHLGQSYRS